MAFGPITSCFSVERDFSTVLSETILKKSIHLIFILQAFSDHSDSVSRRMGFIPLPLGVVMIRVIGTAVRAHTYGSIIIFMLAYFCLVTFRYVVQCQKP